MSPTDPTPLSPGAQAVLDAFRAVPDLRDCPSIAAALRAAADQVGQTPAARGIRQIQLRMRVA